ncbi:hypothetical protein D0868_10328 [Hortaea werneckii]|uniref:Chitin-binding type-1 domain-containing protein n=1 Tax=Hortaea werneckii TaxID=91943 RepID=A0A3M6Y4M9_HORWE|nr:hypothetical protein D0868_10328 [Hortaea werneckii]
MRTTLQLLQCSILLNFCFLVPFGLSKDADGSCSKDAPCEQGCCGATSYCGFGPEYCGDGCVAGCDAQAKCGQYAPTPGQKCPLNVCCSQYGYITICQSDALLSRRLTSSLYRFCGTTADFCNFDCQSGCEEPQKPGCSESWATTRTCDAWKISDFDASKWTHINFAFALIDKTTYEVAQMAPTDIQQYV